MDFANGSNNSFTILLFSLANVICAKVNRSQDDLAALFCGRRLGRKTKVVLPSLGSVFVFGWFWFIRYSQSGGNGKFLG